MSDNISTSKEPIHLEVGACYIVVDALYIADIKVGLASESGLVAIDDMRQNIFPYTSTPFAEFVPTQEVFHITQICKYESADLGESVQRSVCSVDSGILMFVKQSVFLDFITSFDYDDLLSSSTVVDTEYWHAITARFLPTDVAIVVSPGINEGVDFEGGGTYKMSDS